MPTLEVNHPQHEFLSATTPFRGFVGGYRSGKTFVGCVRLWQLASKFPGIKLGYFAPTYPHIRDIFYDTVQEVGELFSGLLGVDCKVQINKSEHRVTMFINGVTYATVKCKSMDQPYGIVGFDISHALIDEIDCMKKEKADAAWKKIVARMSSVREDYKVNTVDFTTTPEGFNWMYDFFVKKLREQPEMQQFYSLVKASTKQNAANLPSDYIDKLYATYPENLVEAYVNGEFVNLLSGTVYNQYTKANISIETVQESDKTLYIGMDFNVTNMAACVFVYRGKRVPHCVDEFTGLYDTSDMIENIKMRYPGKKIVVYPDASGKNRKSNAADVTDIKLLKKAGFSVKAKDANPRVKTRVNATNAMFKNAGGEHRLFVNRDKCPETHDCLEQQIYNDKGEPDKAGGKDHQTDAFSYFIVYEHPIADRLTERIRMSR
jgi:hypothetical protein